MSIERAKALYPHDSMLQQSAHIAIVYVCQKFYSHHRNYLLSILDKMSLDYEMIETSYSYDKVSVWFYDPKGLGIFEDWYGFHYDIYEDRVEIKKIYLIDGDLVRMKYKVEGFK